MQIAAPIRIAVVGAGHWGPNLIRNFHNRPASVVRAVVDRDGRAWSRWPRGSRTSR